MEDVLSALRRHSAGVGGEDAVFRAAAALPLALARPAVEALGREGSAGDGEGEEGVIFELEIETPLEAGGELEFGPPPEEQCDHAPASDDDVEPAPEAPGRHGRSTSELYTWGRSANYQLGYGIHAGEQAAPRLVSLPRKMQVNSVACGRFHSVAVATCGSVLCWGFGGTTGRLGLDAAHAGEFGPGRHVAAKAAAGLGHTLVVSTAGKVLAWGSNEYGQLGVSGVGTGEGAHARRPQLLKTGVLRGEAVQDIAAGSDHSLCITQGGNVFVWGSNERGALGLGAPPVGPAQASSPQQLPHLRGACAVAASASLHVSVVLAGHGDAVIFGGLRTRAAAEGRGSTGGRASDAAAQDAKVCLPTRVRRHERPASDLAAQGAEEWL
eukprot:CAMPEP_0117601226 /NCGR_PEP_ID=MMETSP0784-20121206/76913_1 /TAXON_ID=39447 /ORGANISM="" /LENGTH=381 /DNA_ID=CAMNT_0005403921 /DNA_START=119 /DNA_END=1260 /DNA_ORIENTATION=+